MPTHAFTSSIQIDPTDRTDFHGTILWGGQLTTFAIADLTPFLSADSNQLINLTIDSEPSSNQAILNGDGGGLVVAADGTYGDDFSWVSGQAAQVGGSVITLIWTGPDIAATGSPHLHLSQMMNN